MSRCHRKEIWCFVLFLGACTTSLDAELMEVQDISHSRLEVDDDIEVHGEGFFSGRIASIVFEGEFYRPGHRARTCEVVTTGQATSADTVAFRVEDELVQSLGGRGTFVGTVRVSFPTADQEGRVSGVLEGLRLNFVPGPADRLAEEVSRREAARSFERRLGVELEGDPRNSGLIVMEVEEDSVAARLGIGFGDRIEAVDQVWLDTRSDFLPTPREQVARLLVRRSGETESRTLTVDLGARVADEQGGGVSVYLLAIVALVAFWIVLFLAPTARITAWASRQAQAIGFGENWLQPVIETRTSEGGTLRLRWGLASMATAALVTLSFGALPILADVVPGGADAGLVILVAIACRLTFKMLTRGDRASTGESAAALFFHQLPSVTLILVVLVQVGTLRVDGVVQGQGPLPWDWLIFQQPALLLVFPAFMVTSLSTSVAQHFERHVPLAVVDHTFLLVLCGLGATMFLGGWAPLWDHRLGELAGVLFFVIKGWLLFMAALFLAHARYRERASTPWGWVVVTCVLALGLGFLTLLNDVPDALHQLSGMLLFVCSAAVGLYLLVRRYWRRAESARLHVYPFL